ncbi:MAG: TRAP transporter substrate-binding protein [Dehalococcoidales bacterium]|nr:TRAP transporter substrate-binding protein [Dehalococcoidales bacterium]
MTNYGSRRLFWLTLVLIVLLSLAGCSHETQTPLASSAPPSATSTSSAPAATTQGPAGNVYELRLSHHDTTVSDAQRTFEEMAKRVAEATDGQIKITIYPSETLAKSKDLPDAVASGLADIGWGITGTIPGRFLVFDIFNMPALGFIDAKMATATMNHIVEKFPEAAVKELGPETKLLYLASTATDVVGTKDKPVRAMADFQGLKLRSAGATGTAHLKAMGAVPVMMTPGDIYTNVEKGVIDGWNMPISGAYNFKLNEVTKYYTLTSNWCGPLFTIMNADKFNSLPKDLQDKMMSVINLDFAMFDAEGRDKSITSTKEWAVEKGGELIELAPEEKAKMQAAAKPIWDEHAAAVEAKGLPGKAILEEVLKFVSEYQPGQ